MVIHGSCHCGNIAFDLDWRSDPVEIPARACGCTFCLKHGGVWTSNPAASLEVTVREGSRVAPYTFGTKTATFHVCKGCGVVPVVTSRIDDRLYAVVSVNALEGEAAALARRAPVSFDGEDTDRRLERRKRNWIGEVRYRERLP